MNADAQKTGTFTSEPLVTLDQVRKWTGELCQSVSLASFVMLAINKTNELDDELALSYDEIQGLVLVIEQYKNITALVLGELTDLFVKIERQNETMP